MRFSLEATQLSILGPDTASTSGQGPSGSRWRKALAVSVVVVVILRMLVGLKPFEHVRNYARMGEGQELMLRAAKLESQRNAQFLAVLEYCVEKLQETQSRCKELLHLDESDLDVDGMSPADLNAAQETIRQLLSSEASGQGRLSQSPAEVP